MISQDRIAQVLLCNTLSDCTIELGISIEDLKQFIKKSPYLSLVYQSKGRKERILKKNKEKKKVVPKFKKKLNYEGCKRLSILVIKRAVKERDYYFFESDNYLMYQSFLDNGFEKEDYQRMIKQHKTFVEC